MADHRPSASPRARSRQRRRRRDRSHDCARRVRHVHHVSSVRSGSAHPRPPYRRIEPTARARFGDARGPTPRILGDGASRDGRSPSPPARAAPAARSPASTPPGAQRRRAQAAPTPPAKPRRPKKTGAAGARFLVMRSASPIADQGLLPSNMSMICRFSSGVTGGGVRPAAPAEPSASFALTVGLAAGLKSTLATKPAPGVRSA